VEDIPNAFVETQSPILTSLSNDFDTIERQIGWPKRTTLALVLPTHHAQSLDDESYLWFWQCLGGYVEGEVLQFFPIRAIYAVFRLATISNDQPIVLVEAVVLIYRKNIMV
jgi:hypothetical protein